jgi:hypothetical protein
MLLALGRFGKKTRKKYPQSTLELNPMSTSISFETILNHTLDPSLLRTALNQRESN